jgi:hypothetical protein
MTLPDDRKPIAPPIAPRSPAPSPANRSRITNDPATRHGRSAEGRRVKDLYAGYLSALGHPTDVPTMALALAAAEAVALAEVARRECLAGLTGINSETVVRFENMANRSLRRLGLAKATPKPSGPTLAEYLARKYAETTKESEA